MIYSDALKTARMQLVSDLIAGKAPALSTGPASAGKLVIGTSALSGLTGILAVFTFPTTPFVISGSGDVVATLQGVPLSVNALATGIAAKAEFRTSTDVVVVSDVSVGTSGANINLASTAITVGQPATVTSGHITHG